MSTLDIVEDAICIGCNAAVSDAEMAGQDMTEVNGETLCNCCWGNWKAEMAACTHEWSAGTCGLCGSVPLVCS